MDEVNLNTLGIIIAHTAAVHDDAEQAVNLGLEAMQRGKKVGFFLISDGVWNAVKGSGKVSEGLTFALSKGGKVFLSGEHVRAAGVPSAKLIDGAEVLDKAYESLVDLIMEKWEKVIIC